MIRSIAALWLSERWVFRVLVLVSNDDFLYVYIPASNYQFAVNDIVSWNADTFYWHAAQRTLQFDLFQNGVRI